MYRTYPIGSAKRRPRTLKTCPFDLIVPGLSARRRFGRSEHIVQSVNRRVAAVSSRGFAKLVPGYRLHGDQTVRRQWSIGLADAAKQVTPR
jgi:hypothetical protein